MNRGDFSKSIVMFIGFVALFVVVMELYMRRQASFTNDANSMTYEDTQPLRPPQDVELKGRVVSKMTYGRISLKNLTNSESFSYFVAEPRDVIEDGVLRYSPTTRGLGGDVVKIRGKMTEKCFWDIPEYFGCVPLVMIDQLEKL